MRARIRSGTSETRAQLEDRFVDSAGLEVGDHVALVNDGVSIVATVTAIDDAGYIHLSLR